ncbi:fibulin-2-like isoform X2 [Mauremys reevesii]|uniref:fibulin-2-like isoform X2 n=1 Tax=Mauremys reevesii TaxID=260615 RepID=UPI00193FB679|nr:fibulin-2-like isoform X2 [Mauremys reevesii]
MKNVACGGAWEGFAENMKPEHVLCLLLSCFPLPKAACKPLKADCTLVKCSPCPDQHTAVPSENNCCATCAPPCSCPDYQQLECTMQGYEDGNVPVGKSFHINFATELCTCVSTGNISCTSVCPTVSPMCKETGSPPDGCPQCVCPIDNDRIVVAGSTIPRDSEICVCPPEGGKLFCTSTTPQLTTVYQ